MRLRNPKAQGFGTNVTLITVADSLRLRWTLCTLTVLNSILHLNFLSLSLFLCIVLYLMQFFIHKASSLRFGCHSVVCVRSMSVAPSCLPPPTLELLNEPCGSLAVARSRASSSSTLIDQPTTLSSSLALVQYLNSWTGLSLELFLEELKSFFNILLDKIPAGIDSWTVSEES